MRARASAASIAPASSNSANLEQRAGERIGDSRARPLAPRTLPLAPLILLLARRTEPLVLLLAPRALAPRMQHALAFERESLF
jgi:hypothetical protein